MTKQLLRRVFCFVGVTLLPGMLLAWQLADKTLAERVDDANLIVIARIGAIHSRNPSPIMGVGDVWLVNLRVSKTIKGMPPDTLRVSFVDAAVKERRTFQPDQERLWLLTASADANLLAAPAAYESVLLASDEAQVRAVLKPSAQSPLAADPRR